MDGRHSLLTPARSFAARPRRAGRAAAPLPEWGWSYFSRRMRSRHRLHRAMRALLARLGGTTSMMPGEGHRELLGLELQLDRELPEELWDLWRFYGGQPAYARSGIFNGARMLTVSEVVALLQPGQLPSPQSPAEARLSGRDMTRWAPPGSDLTGSSAPESAISGGSAPGSAILGGFARGDSRPVPEPLRDGEQGPDAPQHAALGPCAGLRPAAIPLSDTVRGGKYYAMDPAGTVLLMSGLYAHRVAGSLAEFIQGNLLK